MNDQLLTPQPASPHHNGKMKVVHLIKATGIAGAEAHVLTLLPALRDYGVDSELILLEDARRPQTELRRRMDACDIPLRTIPIRWHLDPGLPSELYVALRAKPFDILHAHLPHGEFYGELAMRAFPQSQFVISRHNDDRFRRWLPVQLAFGPSLRRAATMIAISRAVEHFLVDVEHVPSSKVVCIPYGLDADAYARKSVSGRLREELAIGDRPLVLFVGRMTAQKGVDILLEAFAKVEKERPQAFLALAGDGPLRIQLERQAAVLGLRNARFLGWRTDIPNLMADADIFVMPSRWEGFGLTALEAMALAKPVVASRISALPEIIIDKETGFLVPPNQSAPLEESILRLMQDPGWARSLGLAGRARVGQVFTVARMAEKTALLYRHLLKTE
jgi:glycosyltransferase involved in cell wall biosynthesis